MGINEDLKKVLLAGIGAVATTAEKAQEVVDTLIKKGEITVEQGKVLNEELKRVVKDKQAKQDAPEKGPSIVDQLDQLNEEEIAAIKNKLAEMEK